MQSSKKQLVINTPPAAITPDGQQIAVNNTTGEVSLVFIQVDPFNSNENTISGMAVANIRMPINSARELRDSLNKSIDDFDQKRPLQ